MKPIITKINDFEPSTEEGKNTKNRFLEFISKNPVDCFLRSNLTGHITASAFVIDPVKHEILLIEHKKLNKWLQPGGHCDGDEDTLAVAIKEVWEETGVVIIPTGQKIIDLDIHTIPERKGVPEHEHFDVRYVFETDSSLPLTQNHETTDLRWIPFEELDNFTRENSIFRIISKI